MGDHFTLERGGQIRACTGPVICSPAPPTFASRSLPTTPRTYPSDDDDEGSALVLLLRQL